MQRIPFPPSTVQIKAPKISCDQYIEKRTVTFFLDSTYQTKLIETLFPRDAIGATGRLLRAARPFYPGRPHLIAQSVDFSPIDEDKISIINASTGEVASSAGVKATITYAPLSEYVDYISLDCNLSAEFIKVPMGGTTGSKLEDAHTSPGSSASDQAELAGLTGDALAAKKKEQDIRKGITANTSIHELLPKQEISVTWHRIPKPNWKEIDLVQGTTNRSRWFFSPPDTVLFLGASTKEYLGPYGNLLYDITYKFSKRSKKFTAGDGTTQDAGWNHVFKPNYIKGKESPWQLLDPVLYKKADWEGLFLCGVFDMHEQVMMDSGLDNGAHGNYVEVT